MTKNKSIIILAIFTILIILGTVFAFVSLDNGELGIYDYTAYPKKIKLGLDLKGGVYAVFEAKDDGSDNFQERLDGTARSLEQLLFDKGYTEASVSLQGSNRIRVEVPDVDDPEQIFNLISRPATLEFKASGSDDALVDGKMLESAYVTTDENGNYAIGLTFNSEGTKAFADATQNNIGKSLDIYINNELVMSPTVPAQITNGRAIITGDYTYDTAYEMAVKIQSGAFDVDLTTKESKTIGPSLGMSALKNSLIAGAIGLAFIFVFMIFMYKMLGVCASIALALYTISVLFFFSIFPWVQLTLPGIAGVIIGLGMAVDANIIIFERIKDEYRDGKSLETSVKEGFGKAFSAIIDGNITTIIGTIVIWIFGASTIKGFAITLLIGIIISLITALIISRILIKCFLTFTTNNKVYGLKRAEGENNG